MTETNFEIKINVPMIKELVSDKIYRSDASAFREQYVNALSHGCVAYHEKHGYSDDVFVKVVFDYGLRKVTVTDNGMGMQKSIFSDNFMSFGFSTVDKESNNSRSGMFGLGAISFFRIASACIVESWDRETDERFTFMTRNTDESEFVANRTLEDYGTKTEIFLKPNVRIDSLIHMVQNIAENYPVKTVLETVNSEQEQSISTYNDTDGDMYKEYERVEKFSDFVDKATEGRGVKVVDNEEFELYLSTKGGNRNYTYLCRIPIDISYHAGFTTYLNIKKEKIPGEDINGKPRLQEVPKPDRDEVNEIASDYFNVKITDAIDSMLLDINIKDYDEYMKSEQRWILDGFNVDDKLNPNTHRFVQKMREPVRWRDANGIQKRHESLLTLHSRFKNVMWHSSLHKGTYQSIYNHLVKTNDSQNSDNILVMVDDPHLIPITDAKQYKKEKKLKTVVTGGSNSPKGLLVRDGTYSGKRLQTDDIESTLRQYPGGIYYANGLIPQNELRNTYLSSEGDTNRWYLKLLERTHTGVIISKKGEKLYPKLDTLLDEIIDASKKGLVKYKSHGRSSESAKTATITSVDFSLPVSSWVRGRRSDYDESYVSDEQQKRDKYMFIIDWFQTLYSVPVLPIQVYKSLPHMSKIKDEIVFMPAKFMHFIMMLKGAYHNDEVLPYIAQGKYSPWLSSENESIQRWVWKLYSSFNSRYQDPNYKCRDGIMRSLVEMKKSENITHDGYDQIMNDVIMTYDESSYKYNISYEEAFPEVYLKEKANRLGYENTIITTDDYGEKVLKGFAEVIDGQTPVEIDGKYYTAYANEPHRCKAVISETGMPIIIDPESNREIVKKDGKLMFIQEIE